MLKFSAVARVRPGTRPRPGAGRPEPGVGIPSRSPERGPGCGLYLRCRRRSPHPDPLPEDSRSPGARRRLLGELLGRLDVLPALAAEGLQEGDQVLLFLVG